MTILCYHSVSSVWKSSLCVTPKVFETHCSWLSGHRWMIDVHDAIAAMNQRGRLPRGWCALTFDDGFADVYENALPILVKNRLPATVFLVAKTLDGGQPVDWVDDIDGPVPPDVHSLSVDQVREMQDNGVAFESHSYSHLDLTRLSEEECLKDLRRSREVIEEVVQGRVRLLAYPRGRHSEHVRRAAGRAGFEHAFTLPNRSEPAGSFSIPRVGIYGGNDLGDLKKKVSWWYLPLRTSPLSSFLAGHGWFRRRLSQRVPS